MNNVYRGKECSQFLLNVKILFFSFPPSLSLILSHTQTLFIPFPLSIVTGALLTSRKSLCRMWIVCDYHYLDQ